MKKSVIVFSLLCIFCLTTLYGQTAPQYGTWNTAALRGGFRQITLQIAFKLTPCNPKAGGMTGNSYYRTNNLKAWPGVFVSFDFDYERCDGSTGTEHVNVSLATPGVIENDAGSWFMGSKIIHPYYNVVIKDPVFDKALALKDQVDELGIQLAEKYNKISLDLLKIKDPKVRQEYLMAVNNIRGKIETAERNAQSDYLLRDGNKMEEEMKTMKAWGDQYDVNGDLIQSILGKQETVNTAPLNLSHDVRDVQQPGSQQQNTNVNAQAVKPVQTNTAAQAQVTYQQSVAQKQQAMAQQRQQIQQTNETNVNNTAAALTNFIGTLGKSKNTAPAQTDAEMEDQAKKGVQADMESKGWVYDANGNVVSTPESRASQAAADAGIYQDNYNRLGKYQQTKQVYLTPELIKQSNNNTTVRQTMDFIASTLWKYTDVKSIRWAYQVTDEMSFVDSVFRYKYHFKFPSDKDGSVVIPSESKIDFSLTPVTYFEILPVKESYDFVILNIATNTKNQSLSFMLSLDCVADDIPDKLVKAFTHLITLSRNTN